MIDPSKDTMQKIEPIIDLENPSEIKGFKV